MNDSEEKPIKAPAPFKAHRERAYVVKRPPDEMRKHMLRILSEAFGKVNTLEEASEIARFNLQLTGGE